MAYFLSRAGKNMIHFSLFIIHSLHPASFTIRFLFTISFERQTYLTTSTERSELGEANPMIEFINRLIGCFSCLAFFPFLILKLTEHINPYPQLIA
jgi:hypothetical protein